MVPLNERLKQRGLLIADGALGTMLFKKGLKPGESPERFNLEHPEVLEEIAKEYFLAGAEIIQTNTFGASPFKLEAVALEPKTEEVNAAAVRAVRKAVGDKAYVSGSCGPCGKLLKPFGNADGDVVYESFRRQMKILIDEGIDLICIETMTDLNEALLAVRAARSLSPTLPVFATMTFDATPRGFFTVMGNSIEEAAGALTAAGATVTGSNCGNGIVKMIRVAEEFKKHTTLPLIIQSNAGIPTLKHGVLEYPEDPEFMAEKTRELITMGVKVIGGCCGTTPEHIAAIRKITTLK